VGSPPATLGSLESERSEGLYWRYESAIKRLESSIGSVVGGDGAIYAIRRALYVPMAADSLSDFMNPLQIVKAGHRVVYEPSARSFEHAGESFQKEFRRKVRIVNRAWRATLRMRALLNPLRFGFFAVELWSHKVFRWLMPLVMLGLVASNVWLAPARPLYGVLLGLHAVKARRGLRPARQPALVGQDLQVPAHRRLRELEDVAQRGHPELVALEQAQQPEPRGVGEGLQAADEGGDLGGASGEDDGSSHQSIRMKG